MWNSYMSVPAQVAARCSVAGRRSWLGVGMRCSVFLIFSAWVLVASGKQQSDSFSVDSVLNNPRVLNAYLKCVLGTGPCTKEGRELKRLLPEVLKTACKSCTQSNKENLRKFLRRVEADPKLSDAWRKVLEKYDPHRQYRGDLEKFVNTDYD